MTDDGGWSDLIAEAVGSLDDGAVYVVIVADRAVDEVDAYGPLPGTAALAEADRVRRDLDAQRLRGVTVRIVRLHPHDAADRIGSAAAPE